MATSGLPGVATASKPSERTLQNRPVAEDNTRLGIGMMVMSTILFAVLWAFVKALSERYPVFEVTFFRNLFALVPVVGLVTRNGWRKTLRVSRLSGHVWRSVVGVGAMTLSFLSYHLLPLADAVAISFAIPLMVTALSVPILGERVGIYRWSAVIVGFGGVLVIVEPGSGVLTAGAMVAAAAACCGAFTTLTVRQLSRTDHSLTIVFLFTVFSSVITALPLPFIWQTPTLPDWGLLLAMGLVAGTGQVFMTRALALAPAAVVSPFNYAGLIWATLLGWLVWGDVPSPHVFFGAVIVIASGLFILYRETRRRSEVRPVVPPC